MTTKHPRPTVSKLVNDIASGDILVNWANPDAEPTYHEVAATDRTTGFRKRLYVSPDLPDGRHIVTMHRQSSLIVVDRRKELMR